MRSAPSSVIGLGEFGPEYYQPATGGLTGELAMFCKTCGHTQPCARSETPRMAHVTSTLGKAKVLGAMASYPWICSVCGTNPTKGPKMRQR